MRLADTILLPKYLRSSRTNYREVRFVRIELRGERSDKKTSRQEEFQAAQQKPDGSESSLKGSILLKDEFKNWA
jgi:hypothetical protein